MRQAPSLTERTSSYSEKTAGVEMSNASGVTTMKFGSQNEWLRSMGLEPAALRLPRPPPPRLRTPHRPGLNAQSIKGDNALASTLRRGANTRRLKRFLPTLDRRGDARGSADEAATGEEPTRSLEEKHKATARGDRGAVSSSHPSPGRGDINISTKANEFVPPRVAGSRPNRGSRPKIQVESDNSALSSEDAPSISPDEHSGIGNSDSHESVSDLSDSGSDPCVEDDEESQDASLDEDDQQEAKFAENGDSDIRDGVSLAEPSPKQKPQPSPKSKPQSKQKPKSKSKRTSTTRHRAKMQRVERGQETHVVGLCKDDPEAKLREVCYIDSTEDVLLDESRTKPNIQNRSKLRRVEQSQESRVGEFGRADHEVAIGEDCSVDSTEHTSLAEPELNAHRIGAPSSATGGRTTRDKKLLARRAKMQRLMMQYLGLLQCGARPCADPESQFHSE